MSAGQMVEDVRLVVRGRVPVHFFGRTGGAVPMPHEILSQLMTLADRPDEVPRLDINHRADLQGPVSGRMAA